MPSQQVIEKLEQLKSNLEEVSVAIKHIEDASKVAKTAADILKKIPELLADLKAIEEKHRKDLQKDLKEKIEEIEKSLQQTLLYFKAKSKQLSQLIEDSRKLIDSISNFFVEIKKINFVDRLDKIDNQISSINISIGNLQAITQRSQEKIENGFDETNKKLIDGFSSANNIIKNSKEQVIIDLSSHINTKSLEVIKHLTEQNQLLKKEFKTNK